MNLNKRILPENVLNLIYGWKNEKNSKWIKKYINILSDSSNETAKKFEKHHIIPCFSFKDETHKNRSQTEPLANKIEGNLIKLSYYNHIIAHYCLWKIFDTWESRNVVQQRCGTKDIETLSESQIKKIAKIQEECAKENMTEEEYREHAKKYREENRDEINKQKRQYYEENKDEINKKRQKRREENRDEINKKSRKRNYVHKEEKKERRRKCYEENKDKIHEDRKIYREENKEKISEQKKESYERNKEKILKKIKEYYEENKDEINERRRENYKEDEENRDKILENNRIYREENKEEIQKHNHLLCYDPKKDNFCTLQALHTRKYRNKELYKDVIPSECIVDEEVSVNEEK